MVVTSHNAIDATHPTGLWFEEFAVPYKALQEHGFTITVASPLGGNAPIDPRSEDAAQNEASIRDVLQHTHKLTEVNAANFDAIFIPGGHGTMFDLPEDTTLQALLKTFADTGKIIASVCHGPASLVGVRLADGTPLVAGKRLTAFTDDEERAAQLDTRMPFLLESRLRELGGVFIEKPNWSDHVERDGNLITGQNPQSSASVAQALIEALD